MKYLTDEQEKAYIESVFGSDEERAAMRAQVENEPTSFGPTLLKWMQARNCVYSGSYGSGSDYLEMYRTPSGEVVFVHHCNGGMKLYKNAPWSI